MTHWFIELKNPAATGDIVRELAAIGIEHDAQCVDVFDGDGKEHTGWFVPLSFISLLRAAKGYQKRVQFLFNFYKKEHAHAPLQIGNPFEKDRHSVIYLRTRAGAIAAKKPHT
jgi:hypothetical protein